MGMRIGPVPAVLCNPKEALSASVFSRSCPAQTAGVEDEPTAGMPRGSPSPLIHFSSKQILFLLFLRCFAPLLAPRTLFFRRVSTPSDSSSVGAVRDSDPARPWILSSSSVRLFEHFLHTSLPMALLELHLSQIQWLSWSRFSKPSPRLPL